MNFLGHAVLAAKRDATPGFVLGAMLPDFASMARLRLEEVGDEVLRAGVEFHHRTDEAFHGAPLFVELMGQARDDLEDVGVELGPAMAVGHVGVELLLDGWLVERHGGVPSFYGSALAAAEQFGPTVRWRTPDGDARWQRMMARLAKAPVPQGYTDPGFVVDRLVQILSPRPRLALDEEAQNHVRAWSVGARERVARHADELLFQVETRMRT